jgi:hypothetical protein
MVKIRVNAYDLTPLNRVLRCIHFGIYHTSVVIDERREYYYGFYRFGLTGIDTALEVNHLPPVMNGILYASFEMGDSYYTYEQCEQIVQRFRAADRWLSDHYNIIWHNCNTFSYELCADLLGAGNLGAFPLWVGRFEAVAKFIVSVSMSHVIYMNNCTLAVIGRPPAPEVKAVEEPEPHEGEEKEIEAS